MEEISDAELRSKVAHVLFERKKHQRILPLLVDAYLQAASALETDDMWVPFADRLEQALLISAKCGKGKPLFNAVVTKVEDAIARRADSENGLLSERLMGCLLGYRVGAASTYSVVAGSIGERLAAAHHWHFARRYWRIKAAWDRRANDRDSASNAELAAAECYVSEAEGVANLQPKPNFMSAAHWMTKGVHALRQARADPERIKQVHLILLEFQRNAAERDGLTPRKWTVEK